MRVLKAQLFAHDLQQVIGAHCCLRVNTQNSPTFRDDASLSNFILFTDLIQVMDASVDFDRQPHFHNGEVDNIGTNRMLPPDGKALLPQRS